MSNSNIPSSSTLNKIPKVLVDRKMKDRNGKVVTAKATVPVHQMANLDHTETVYTQSMKGVPANLFRNSGAKFSATLEQKAFAKLLSATVKINVSHTSDVIFGCFSPTYWFHRIEFRSADGSKHLNMLYDDNIHFALCTSEDSVYKSTKKLLNYPSDTLYNIILSQSDTVYIPLLGSWLESADLWFRNIQGDIVVDFYPRSQIYPGVYNSKMDVSVQSMDFVIQTEELSEQELQLQEKFHSQIASETSFLDIVPVNFYNHKLQAQSTTKFELDAVTGDVAFFVMYVKSQAQPSGPHPFNPVSIGKHAQIDVLTPGSKSIIGSGSGIDLHYLNNLVLPTHFHNHFMLDHPNIVVIPFCSSVTKSMFGVKTGSMYLDGSRYYLSVTPDSTFASGNYDVVIYAYKFATILNNKGRLSIHHS